MVRSENRDDEIRTTRVTDHCEHMQRGDLLSGLWEFISDRLCSVPVLVSRKSDGHCGDITHVTTTPPAGANLPLDVGCATDPLLGWGRRADCRAAYCSVWFNTALLGLFHYVRLVFATLRRNELSLPSVQMVSDQRCRLGLPCKGICKNQWDELSSPSAATSWMWNRFCLSF